MRERFLPCWGQGKKINKKRRKCISPQNSGTLTQLMNVPTARFETECYDKNFLVQEL
jgi:hypothetical protein